MDCLRNLFVVYWIKHAIKSYESQMKKGIPTPSIENAGFFAVSMRSVTTIFIGIRIKKWRDEHER
jgi:hypothetical protein